MVYCSTLMSPILETRLERTRRKGREYYAANREELAAKALQHFRDNRDKVLAQQRAWYERNREAKLARTKKWREDNPEKTRAYSRKNRKKNKKKKRTPKRVAGERSRKIARKAKIRGSEVKNCPSVKALYEIAWWLRKLGHDVHVDHIYPLSKGGPHVFENLRIITAAENILKSDKILEVAP